MGNRLSPGEKVVVTVFMAVLAAATAGLVFLGTATLGMASDIGELRAEFAEFRVEVLGRLDRVEERLDRVETRLSSIETVMQTHHGPLPRPAN